MKIKTIFLWHNIGNYHLARMNALASSPDIDLHVIEICSFDKEHPYCLKQKINFNKTTICKKRQWSSLLVLFLILIVVFKINPQAVVIPGYYRSYFLLLAFFLKFTKKKVILFSESQALDRPQPRIKSYAKRLIIKLYDGVFVVGEASRKYMLGFGCPPSKLFEICGDVVDNAFFTETAIKIRENKTVYYSKYQLPEDYFLYVGRFENEKNLFFLLNAYKLYQKRNKKSWGLVLVGSGSQEKNLKDFVLAEKLTGVNFFPFQQLPGLVMFYALANVFILPSTSEPWGLVVNEAAACSLPLLVSTRCGCAPELIKDGENGFMFNPLQQDTLAGRMAEFSEGRWNLKQFGEKSLALVGNLRPGRFKEKTVSALRSLISGVGL